MSFISLEVELAAADSLTKACIHVCKEEAAGKQLAERIMARHEAEEWRLGKILREMVPILKGN